jgi:hypothetical protein
MNNKDSKQNNNSIICTINYKLNNKRNMSSHSFGWFKNSPFRFLLLLNKKPQILKLLMRKIVKGRRKDRKLEFRRREGVTVPWMSERRADFNLICDCVVAGKQINPLLFLRLLLVRSVDGHRACCVWFSVLLCDELINRVNLSLFWLASEIDLFWFLWLTVHFIPL